MTFWHKLLFSVHRAGPVGYLLVVVGIAGLFSAPITLISRVFVHRPALRYAGSIACLALATVAAVSGALTSQYRQYEVDHLSDPALNLDLEPSRQRFLALPGVESNLVAPAWLGLACATVPLIGGIGGLLLLSVARIHGGTSDPGRPARWQGWLVWTLLPAAGISTVVAWRVTTRHFPGWNDKPWDLLVAIAQFERNRGEYDRPQSCMRASSFATDVANNPGFQRWQYGVGFEEALRDLTNRCSDWTLDKLNAEKVDGHSPPEELIRYLKSYRPFLDAAHLAHFDVEWSRLFPPLPPPRPIDPMPIRIDGPLSFNEVDAELERILPKFRDCSMTLAVLPHNEVTEYRLNMFFSINRDGLVSSLIYRSQSRLMNDKTLACIRRVMDASKFPKKTSSSSVNQQLLFTRGPGGKASVSLDP